jgi:ankyrin repeat protein
LKDVNLFDQELEQELEKHRDIFTNKQASLSIEEAIQELIQNVNLEDYNALQQWEWLEHVVQIGILPKELHPSWKDSQLLIRMVNEGASSKLIRILIENVGFNVNDLDKEGGNVVHASVRRGGSIALEQLPVLIKAGANTEIQENFTKITPLDIACEKKDLDVFKCLIKLGAGEKAMEKKVKRFYQELTDDIKKDLIPYMTRLIQTNPKL